MAQGLESAAMSHLQLVETSLRAGQQAILVSRLRQRHAVDVATLLDGLGFAALDVFGGSTFEAQMRFCGEDPFDRLRAIRQAVTKTPLMATIAGQALVGHRHYPDDVVQHFVRLACDAGIDIFRCYDPLNDVRNLSSCLQTIHASARRAEGVLLCVDGTEAEVRRLKEMAKSLAEMGFDSLCLQDPLGILGAASAAELVRALRKTTKLPLSLSFVAQTGQADFAYAAAVEAGATCADVALSPLAGGSSVPAAEAIVAGTGNHLVGIRGCGRSGLVATGYGGTARTAAVGRHGTGPD